MRTHLVLVVLFCLSSCSTSQECNRELLENLDFPGTDIKFVYSPDVHHCQQMCTQHPQCLFFTFLRADWARDNRHFYCYLKRTDSGKPSVETPLLGVTSGYSLKPCFPNTSGPQCFLDVYPNVDFPGADYRFLFTPDHKECERACTQDPGCQFYTWVNNLFSNAKIRYKCHLKFSWTFPVTPIVERKDGVVSGFSSLKDFVTSRHFAEDCPKTVLPGVDITGNNLLNLPAASSEVCYLLCVNHPSCTYFSYQGTTCFLKNNPNEMPTVAKQGVTSGIPSRHCAQDSNWLMVTHEGVDFRGSDMRYVMLDDAESCRNACNDDSNCQFYTYVNKRFHDRAYWRRCYLKRTITVATPPKVTKLANVVSGFSQAPCAP